MVFGAYGFGRGLSSSFLNGGGFCKKRRGISCDGFWTYHVHIPACDRPAVFLSFFSLMIDSGREVIRFFEEAVHVFLVVSMLWGDSVGFGVCSTLRFGCHDGMVRLSEGRRVGFVYLG